MFLCATFLSLLSVWLPVCSPAVSYNGHHWLPWSPPPVSAVIVAIVRYHAFYRMKSRRELSFLCEQCYVIGVCYSWLARADALSEPTDRKRKGVQRESKMSVHLTNLWKMCNLISSVVLFGSTDTAVTKPQMKVPKLKKKRECRNYENTLVDTFVTVKEWEEVFSVLIC